MTQFCIDGTFPVLNIGRFPDISFKPSTILYTIPSKDTISSCYIKDQYDHTYISYRRQPGLEICGCAGGEVWLSKKRGVAQLCSSILLYWNRFLLLWTSKQTNLQYKYLFHKLSLPLQVVTYFWLLRRWAHRMDSNWVCWILNRLMRYTSSDRVIWVHLILITHI